MKKYDFSITNLGAADIPSPLSFSTQYGDCIANYVSDEHKIIFQVDMMHGAYKTVDDLGLLERAGPREKIYFHPPDTHAAIVTCGGLCPGINDVIQALVRALWNRYGCRRISGIRYGYHGLLAENSVDSLELTPSLVAEIHRFGGSILASSRGGGERTAEIVDAIARMGIDMLFVIGGDGTQKGAFHIGEEIERRALKIAVVGIPKTIDNDLSFVQRSFGFETAVAKATDAVLSAHAEASSAKNGIGLVQVMGRESGFIAAHTAIGSHAVDIALVPEVPFELDGDNGLFALVEKRLAEQGNAVIVVAEGAGQELMIQNTHRTATDASGNVALGDIGAFMRAAINDHFRAIGTPISLKYINPSYIVRSAVATPADSLYCSRLATHAAHAAMSGKTKLLISVINNHFVHVPIALSIKQRNRIDPEGSLWRDVVDSTDQPLRMTSAGDACRVGGGDIRVTRGINAGSNS